MRAPSLALLAALILALDQREDVRLTKLAAQLPGKALQNSKAKQLHRFFKNIRLSEDVLARFVLSFSNLTERLWLVIDRTIGKKWLKFLNKEKVAPCIRLKANTKVGSMPVWALFKGIPTGEVHWWYRPLMVYGVPLRVCRT